MRRSKHIMVVGATSEIAKCCIDIWARDGINFSLIGRNSEKLKFEALRFKARYPDSDFDVKIFNFENLELVKNMVNEVEQYRSIDTVLLAQGALVDHFECVSSIVALERAIIVNASSHIAFINALHHRIEDNKSFRLVVIGSVAGDLGKKSNYIYGACKSFLETYLQGLQHQVADNKTTQITLVKPGPTRTPMTGNAKVSQFNLADPRKVAQAIVHATDNGKLNVYTPWYWRYVMLVISSMPKKLLYKFLS